MTDRERQIRVLTYKSVDKIPLIPGHGRKSTIERWVSEGMPPGVDQIEYVFGELNIPFARAAEPNYHVNARMIPEFEEQVLAHENGHYIVRDWMGAITEISDEFDYTYIRNAIDFVTRKWHRFPVQTREDWESMKTRFDPHDPRRYPENMPSLKMIMRDRPYFASLRVNGPFWQMREWLGFENLCTAFIDDPKWVAEMAAFWGDFVCRLIETAAPHIPFDALCISEDMAYKAHAMISPAMTREFLMPVYKKWTTLAHKYGIPIIDMDSDGYVDQLMPVFIDAGINVSDPVEVAAHNNIALYSQKYGASMAYRGGIDKRAIAVGGAVMEAEVRRVCSPFKYGGLIPGCDHGVPHDISLKHFIEYVKCLARFTGWL